MMEELTERQKLILALVVHHYVRSAAPVGSQYLVETYHLDMSSATVRNELAALTEKGLLRQPHTSAGRIPTEEGYRYFVGRLLQETVLPDAMRRTISHQFYQMRDDADQWMRLAASVLAQQSRAASLITAPLPDQARLKHMELISTRGRQVLMVMVMMGGQISQRFLTLGEPMNQETLSIVADRLTRQLTGLSVDAVRALRPQMSGFDLDVIDRVIEELSQTDDLSAGEVYLDGLTNVLGEPEFSGNEEARRALRVLEERSMIHDLLARSLPAGSVGGVQVLIGGEGTHEDLRQFSVVLARYGMPGLATGALGVVGPMRMSYGRTISMVRFLSTLLSDLVSETLVD